jgi:radical SAM superfamily enzyme YgiQ (UPF0313 family)
MRLVLASFLARSFAMLPYSCAALSAYLAAHPEAVGCRVDSQLLALPHSETIMRAGERIEAFEPDVIGLSCYVWNYVQTLALVRILRERLPTACIVVGGPHVSADDPQLRALQRGGYLDHLVLGEGEVALAAIIASRANKAEWREEVVTGGVVPNLNRLPSPYRTEPAMLEEIAHTQTAVIEGARGCPFSCTFCDQGWRKARVRDLALVKDDLRFVYERGARRAIFLDPTFNFDRQRMTELLAFIRNELPELTISAEIKVDILTAEEIEALSLGGAAIEVGIQTSNPETLKRIRRPEKVALIWQNVRRLTRRKIHVAINTIFGLPGETLEDWLKTVDDCYRETEAVITSTCLKILPNTEIWHTQQQYGYRYEDHDLCRAVESNTMSREEFQRAERLSKLLAFLQAGERSIPAKLRQTIDGEFSGSLAAFLYAFERGEVNVLPDGRTVRVVPPGHKALLEAEAGPRTAIVPV